MTRPMPPLPHPAADDRGHLFIIGGAEDREKDMPVLAHLVERTAGGHGGVAVITAASTEPEGLWHTYDRAFARLGVRRRRWVSVDSRERAGDDAAVRAIGDAAIIFMTGGDQKRLLALLGGTPLARAMHEALQRGACIAGTSAGASAMSEHMLVAGGNDDLLPTKGLVEVAAGLGFLRRVVVDQHFSERRRLGRLLAVIAQNPDLLGVGIDEDTALVVTPGQCVEVVGEGGVTLLDGRGMASSILAADDQAPLAISNVRLHLLPKDTRYPLADVPRDPRARHAGRVDPSLQPLVEAIAAIASTGHEASPARPSSPRRPGAVRPRAGLATATP